MKTIRIPRQKPHEKMENWVDTRQHYAQYAHDFDWPHDAANRTMDSQQLICTTDHAAID